MRRRLITNLYNLSYRRRRQIMNNYVNNEKNSSPLLLSKRGRKRLDYLISIFLLIIKKSRYKRNRFIRFIIS